jgi:membrane-associated phospholipid phosphatase
MRWRVQLGLFVAPGPSTTSRPGSPPARLAAVPSLHCGFAFAIGIALAAAARKPWTKALALAWGPIVALSVVTTGNHYVFDIAAGLLVSVAGYVVGGRVSRLVATRSLRLTRPVMRPRVAEAVA